MRAALAKMPPVEYPVILVAGTNGKGSVSWLISEILRAHGLSTGLSTSPHLITPRERIVVDGKMITEADFADLYDEIEELDENEATYFETLALMAIRYFQKRSVDVAVCEMGMGGRLDAFNALEPLVSVVTSIGLEHTRYLGDTLEKIGLEKIQIARKGCDVVVPPQPTVLRREAEELGARVTLVSSDLSDYRARNLETATNAARIFLERTGRKFNPDAAMRCAERTRWAGRFHEIDGSPTIILDACHNPAAAEALSARLKEGFNDRRIIALVAFLEDKDAAGIFSPLSVAVEKFVVTKVSDRRSANLEDLKVPAGAVKESDLKTAFDHARELAGDSGILLITGSIYLLGDVISGGFVGPFELLGESFG